MTTVEVLVDETGRTRLVGQAHFTRTRGRISTTFLYEPGYLADGGMAIELGVRRQPEPGPVAVPLDFDHGGRRAA